MEILLANLTGRPRQRTFNGREYLVAPATLIVPGVLNGSQGPLLYTQQEISKNPQSWDDVPLVLEHPQRNGEYVSAQEPGVLEKSQLGFVSNSEVNGKLAADLWFDIEKTRKVDPRILSAVEAGKRIEISTGIFNKIEESPGTFNGVSYTGIVRELRPDHLAVLPDSIGACSVKQGCGVFNSENEDDKSIFSKMLSKWFGSKTNNELSHDDIREQLSTQIRKKFNPDEPHMADAFVVDVFDDSFVFERDGKLFQLGFNTKDNSISISEDAPTEVRLVRSFEPVTNSSPTKGNSMDREKVIGNLITNCDCWTEEDRETLNEFSDEKLKALKEGMDKAKRAEAVANSARQGFEVGDGTVYVYNEETGKIEKKEPEKTTPTTNEGSEQSEEEYLASLPPSIREDVEFARNEKTRQKAQLVDQLTSNVEDEEAQQEARKVYDGMSLNALRSLAKAAPRKESEPTSGPNYQGAATYPTSNREGNRGYDPKDYLPVPTMNDFPKDKQTA